MPENAPYSPINPPPMLPGTYDQSPSVNGTPIYDELARLFWLNIPRPPRRTRGARPEARKRHRTSETPFDLFVVDIPSAQQTEPLALTAAASRLAICSGPNFDSSETSLTPDSPAPIPPEEAAPKDAAHSFDWWRRAS